MNKALQAIEESYDIALNPDLDYGAQLLPLGASGELANRISANKVLFKLCMLVDAQAKEIAALKDGQVAASTQPVDPAAPLG